MNEHDKIIVVYDGHCRLCSWGVSWVLHRIPVDKIRYVPVQADEGATIMAKAGLNALNPQTIVVKHGETLWVKSAALLYLASLCSGFTRYLGKAFGFLPRPFRDWLYLWIASRRYRLFGRLDTCFVPSNTAK